MPWGRGGAGGRGVSRGGSKAAAADENCPAEWRSGSPRPGLVGGRARPEERVVVDLQALRAHVVLVRLRVVGQELTLPRVQLRQQIGALLTACLRRG